MQLFLDSTDTAVLRELARTGLVDGVTTNPSLIMKSGRPMLEVIAEICDIVEGPVSAEVAAVSADDMIAEGARLALVAPNVVVKAPLTPEGLIATRELSRQGVQPEAKVGQELGIVADQGGVGLEEPADLIPGQGLGGARIGSRVPLIIRRHASPGFRGSTVRSWPSR